MIWSTRRSVRSWVAPVTVLIGLVWLLLGVVMVAEPEAEAPTRATYVSGVVIGVASALLGGALTWAGLRMGCFRRPGGMVVRQGFTSNSVRAMFRGTTYCSEEVLGLGVTEEEHHSLPLAVVYPTLRLVDETDVPIRALGTFRILPGAERSAWRAAGTIAAWVDRPLLAPPSRRPGHDDDG